MGRGTAPISFNIAKLQNELESLKRTGIKKEIVRRKIEKNTILKKPLDFYEVLEKKADNVEDDKALKKTEPPEKKDPIPDVLISSSEGADPDEKAIMAHKEFTEPGPEYKYTIQVASLKDAETADKMTEGLKKKGYRAYWKIGVIPGKGVWCRVRVGFFKTRPEAKSTMTSLRKEKLSAILIFRSAETTTGKKKP